MKNFKTALAVFIAAALPLALFSSPASAVIGTPDGNDVASLHQEVSATNHTKLPGPFTEGQQISLAANFASGTHTIKIYRNTGGGWTQIGSKTSNSSGNAYFPYTIVAGSQDLYAETSGDLETEVDTIEPAAAPPPGTAVLNPPTNGGKTFTATFSPSANGQSTRLQAQEICTYRTDETDPEGAAFDPDQPQNECQGPWTNRATSSQNSSGSTTFTISNPLEVNHKYRAVSGSTTSNIIEFAAPLPTNPQGIDTGLSEVHFNSYEGDTVNTRDREFEGEFVMTGSERSVDIDGNGPIAGAQCSPVAGMMKSALKGRGNYSWSFPKKSYTLRIGTATGLCGLDSSRKFALVANDYDKSLLRNSLASYVGQKFSNMGWTPRSVPVEFYMNGSYLGSYILIERIAIESGRLDIKELNGNDEEEQVEPKITGGYVLEWDFRIGGDRNINLGSDSGWIGIKEPEFQRDREGNKTDEGISDTQFDWISDYLRDTDEAMRASSCQSSSWEDFIDKASAVDYYIAMEYMKPVDGNMWASVYMYKPRGEKIKFGPMWDFDLAAGSATRAGNVASPSSFYLRNNLGVSAQQSSNTWFNCLNKRTSFRNAVTARWDAIQGSMNVTSFIDQQKALIDKSAQANFKRWSHSSRISSYQVIKSNWSADVSHLRGWGASRKSWLNGSSGF